MCPATTLELGLFVLLKMKKACKHLVYRLLHKFGNIPSGLDGMLPCVFNISLTYIILLIINHLNVY